MLREEIIKKREESWDRLKIDRHQSRQEGKQPIRKGESSHHHHLQLEEQQPPGVEKAVISACMKGCPDLNPGHLKVGPLQQRSVMRQRLTLLYLRG